MNWRQEEVRERRENRRVSVPNVEDALTPLGVFPDQFKKSLVHPLLIFLKHLTATTTATVM